MVTVPQQEVRRQTCVPFLDEERTDDGALPGDATNHFERTHQRVAM